MKTTMWALLGLGLVVACNTTDEAGARDRDTNGRASDARDDAGSSSGSSGGSSSGSAPRADDDRPLVVRGASERTRLGARMLRNGSFFAVVDVSVKNTQDSAFALSLVNFRLVVSDLETVAAADTVELENACPTAGFLTAGGTIECSVAFEVSAVPERIVLATALEDGGDLVRLEAELPAFARCERCGEDTCVDLQTTDEHCGSCDVEAPSSATCVEGRVVCEDEQFYCDGVCKLGSPQLLRDCSNVRTVELETRDRTCAAACGASRCIAGSATYGLIGFPVTLTCDELPQLAQASPFGGADLPFRWLDCYCDPE